MKSDSMYRINASADDLAIQDAIDTEDTIFLEREVAKLPEKLPVLEQVREWVVQKYGATIDGSGRLGLSGQVVHMAQERGLGKRKDMLIGVHGGALL
ncbi:hypothetical protein DPMN_162068 [Dreissena polymorpha]|uniref:Uncharacterized protein n=1 Tax=Dreissena polymorpha TaxID=45954 RepID=A0A9D4ITB2_DREPO|nr:hypothetical protein DPMN_162068 [Dreissena polymorpha]